MSLEVQTNKTAGDEIRVTPAPQPAFIGLMILLLGLLEFVFLVLIFDAVASGANSPTITSPAVEHAPLAGVFGSDQRIISMWLAGAFFTLSFMIFLYQRFFMDHITMAKRRFGKWEDEGVQF